MSLPQKQSTKTGRVWLGALQGVLGARADAAVVRGFDAPGS